MAYQILYSKTSSEQIRKLHPQIKPIVKSRLQTLKEDPYKGKPLIRELAGYFSLRAERFRIMYKIKEKEQMVEIHHVGRRKNIYQLFKENIQKSLP